MSTASVIRRPLTPPVAANDVPLIVMVAPQSDLRVQRSVFSAIGVRFLGFRHGDTALLALLTIQASAIYVVTPVDMTPVAFLAGLFEQGECAPVAVIGRDGEVLPQTPSAARASLARMGVLPSCLRAVT